MFVPDQLVSVNSIQALRPGRYRVDCTAFIHRETQVIYYLYGYTRQGDDSVSATDIVVIYPDGTTGAIDFMLYADGEWRNSYGLAARSLAELLPAELKMARLVEIFELDDRVVENGDER